MSADLDWLKSEGFTEDELKAFETVAGSGKFAAAIKKAKLESENAQKMLQTAEETRINFENRYNNEFIPAMQKVTEESVKATGEAASLRAQLSKAREYGIVPEEAPTRAPGSPDPTPSTPNYVSHDEVRKLANNASTNQALINDLNAKHFKLFGSPVDDLSGILSDMDRERTLGHTVSLEAAWEKKYNVPAKREELRMADQAKHDQDVRDKAVKEYQEKHGTNPNVRVGQPSRFSTYNPSDAASGGVKPWQKPAGLARSANSPWRDQAAQKLSIAGNS